MVDVKEDGRASIEALGDDRRHEFVGALDPRAAAESTYERDRVSDVLARPSSERSVGLRRTPG